MLYVSYCSFLSSLGFILKKVDEFAVLSNLDCQACSLIIITPKELDVVHDVCEEMPFACSVANAPKRGMAEVAVEVKVRRIVMKIYLELACINTKLFLMMGYDAGPSQYTACQ